MEKQPSEIIPCTVDYTKVIPAGDTLLETSSVVVKDAEDEDVTEDIVDVGPTVDSTGKKLTIRVIAGEDGEDYSITLYGRTEQGYLFESDIKLMVREQTP